MNQYKIITILGARPQFIKAAPLSLALCDHGNIKEVLVHTGQHFDNNMSDIFFDELNIPKPAYHLNINNCSHGKMTGQMLGAIEDVLMNEKPDLVLIYGDTNSTLAGALAASKLHIPVAHVEAGLRSFNRSMPEEINRILADHVSTLFFCPTQTAVLNLRNEGIQDKVYLCGDVMYDLMLHLFPKIQVNTARFSHYALVTIHREENTGSPEKIKQILAYLEDYSKNHDLKIVLPLHPRTQKTLLSLNISIKDFSNIQFIDPVGYFDMQCLLHHAAAVLTDSGGVQKEAYFHGKPCITLRNETEWVETIESGWNRLWTQDNYISPRRNIFEYGKGDASRIIAKTLSDYLNTRERRCQIAA